jgi:competence protein ComEC
VVAAACAALLAGIAFGRHGRMIWNYWPGGACIVLVGSVLWNRQSAIALVAVLCTFVIGYARGGDFAAAQAAYEPLYGHRQTIIVTAATDGVYGSHSQLSFVGGSITSADGMRLRGRLLISGFGLNAVNQGDEVRVTGKLYPAQGSYQGRIGFAELSLLNPGRAPFAELRRRFAAGLESVLPEPAAPFAMGLLIGQRSSLPDMTKQELLMAGLTHIIAVSGYNLTIMLHAAEKLFVRRSKRLTAALALGLIVVFLQMTGASASIVRAAIVSVLTLWAGYYGRSFSPAYVILLAAAVTAFANPFYLWSDAGWWLSFLAFTGVLVLAPLVAGRLPGIADSIAGGVLIESLSAEVMTIPYVLHVFGQMSLIALLANVLVVSLIPLAMLLSLMAGVAGMLMPAYGGWVAWPASFLLTYMLDMAHGLAHLPHIFLQNIGVSTTQMFLMYAFIAGAGCVLWGRTKSPKSAIITDKKTLTLSRQGARLERT